MQICVTAAEKFNSTETYNVIIYNNVDIVKMETTKDINIEHVLIVSIVNVKH